MRRKEPEQALLVRSALASRLAIPEAESLLLVDVPRSVRTTLDSDRSPDLPAREVSGEAIRSVKESFETILVWREDRAGSRSLLDQLAKRLAPSGALWIVTAKRKVTGPKTPAARRLELSDLVKAFSKQGLTHAREVQIGAWNVAHQFRAGGARGDARPG